MAGDERPSAGGPRRRSSLALRLVLVASALVLLAVGASVAVTAWIGGRIARQAAADQLDLSHEVQRAFREERYQRLWLSADLFALDPYLAAYVAEASRTADTASMLDLLGQSRERLGFDFAAVLTPEGRVLAHTDRPEALGEDLTRRPLVAKALEDYEASGLWVEGERLFDAVVVPVSRGFELDGFLLVGFRIDDQLARRIRGASPAEMALFRTVGTDGALAPVATTLPRQELEHLAADLAPRFAAAAGPGAGQGGEPGNEPPAGTAPSGAEGERLTLELGGRPWMALVEPLRDASGEFLGLTVTLSSLDEQLATYRRLQWILTGTGAGAVLLAVGLAYPLTRRSLRPVRELARAAEAARRGDYDLRLEDQGSDEVARLAAAFDELLEGLREKRDMEAYMGRLAVSLEDDAPLPPGPGAAAPDPLGQQETLVAPETEPLGRRAVLPPGAVLGERFQVVSVLGSGGMGVVYKARDRELDELVALKVLRRELLDRAEHRSRLKDELKLARRITHPNVLRTYDFGELDGVTFVSMEYVRGVTLRTLLDRAGEPLPFRAALRLSRQVAAGLAAAHELGVVHRDVKPENVILEAAGNAKIMDFGIARPLAGGTGALAEPAHTRAGELVGTPHYIAPERLKNEPADARSDVYSLGIVLYEVFTGRAPFPGGTLPQIVSQHLHEDPQPLTAVRGELPPELEALVLRCMEKSPDGRFSDAGAVLRALDGIRG